MVKMNFNRGAMFKGIFNSGISGRSETKRILENIKPKTEVIVGKPIKQNNRILYPIIQTAFIGNDQNFAAIEIFPIALVVEEQDNEYLISLIDDKINPEELVEKISPKEKREETVIMLLKKISG